MTKKGALCSIIASLVKKCRSRLGKVMVSTFVLETLDLSRHWKAVDLHSLGLSLHNSHSTESSHFPFLSGQRSTSEKRKKEVLYLPSISLEVTFHAHLGKEKIRLPYIAVLIDTLSSILREGLVHFCHCIYPVFSGRYDIKSTQMYAVLCWFSF